MPKQFCIKGHDTWITGRTKQRLCKVCSKNFQKHFKLTHPNYKSKYKKEWALKYKYNISLDYYNKLYLEQAGKCAICGIEKDVLDVDHCHTSGTVRKLLCNNCNRGLGHFKDNYETLIKAAQYIEATKEKLYGRT